MLQYSRPRNIEREVPPIQDTSTVLVSWIQVGGTSRSNKWDYFAKAINHFRFSKNIGPVTLCDLKVKGLRGLRVADLSVAIDVAYASCCSSPISGGGGSGLTTGPAEISFLGWYYRHRIPRRRHKSYALQIARFIQRHFSHSAIVTGIICCEHEPDCGQPIGILSCRNVPHQRCVESSGRRFLVPGAQL
ncbi:hypothetical protein FA15DRAFT_659072 [Coprinopsis marcescibilis]|uniref:Uncharacterized protein n=1 Tax=Coprinopsis marcescibilis TaxID=230819 RepID=A0A5C3KJT6_COPMA|nr:hypothetical protein FA15DRAFT_659072 [Coprinopsis marcescibilis]